MPGIAGIDRPKFALTGSFGAAVTDGHVRVDLFPDENYYDANNAEFEFAETLEGIEINNTTGAWSMQVPDNSAITNPIVPYYRVTEHSDKLNIDRVTFVKMAGGAKSTTTGAVNPPVAASLAGARGGPVVLTASDGTKWQLIVAPATGALSTSAYTPG